MVEIYSCNHFVSISCCIGTAEKVERSDCNSQPAPSKAIIIHLPPFLGTIKLLADATNEIPPLLAEV